MRVGSKVLGIVTLSLIVALGSGCASTATQESTGEYLDSSVVTASVKTALAADDITTLLQIEVETFRDTVQLSGFVDSDAEKMHAGGVAMDVDGVVSVENNLVVKTSN